MIPAIVYEDNDLIAIDKPSGFLCHASSWAREAKDVCSWYQQEWQKKISPLNRIDRSTSGLSLYIKENSKNKKKINQNLPYLMLQKKYHCISRQLQNETYIYRSLKEEKSTSETSAYSEFVPIETKISRLPHKKFPYYLLSLIEANITTGRQHQIRKHLASIQAPIVGDSNYGDNALNASFKTLVSEQYRLLLNASKLSFLHPLTNERLIITSKNNSIQFFWQQLIQQI